MLIQTKAAGGPRNIYDETIMAGKYDHPGLSFEHKAGHDHPVAECRKDVGEALIERYPGVERADEPADDAQDPQDAADTAAADDMPAGADGGAEKAPLVERNPDQLTDVEQRIDSADYEQLRAVAGHLDGVNGNQSATDLRVALHTDADESAVAAAFVAADAEGEQ